MRFEMTPYTTTASRITNLVLLVGLLLSACEDDNPAPPFQGSNPEDNDDKPAGLRQDAGRSRPPVSRNSNAFDVCAERSESGEPVPLDMYIMLDRSGSMNAYVEADVTRWEAIVSAITSFIDDSGSRGLGVGLQFFPLMGSDVPDTCKANADCGDYGPCLFGSCSFSGDFCGTDSDCPGGEDCLPMGRCSEDAATWCLVDFDPICEEFNLGTCVELTSGVCVNGTSCTASDYAQASVPIDTLPDNKNALIDSMSDIVPEGMTPSAPALTGAIEHAHSRAEQNPDRRVVAVFATDGQPTECSPQDATGVAQIAEQGFDLEPSVRTYVIGVLTSTEESVRADLDAIANSGGTEEAIVVEPGESLTDEFLDALEEVRTDVLACEFSIPLSDTEPLDFDEVNVVFYEDEKATELIYVSDYINCEMIDVTGSGYEYGWYYDRNPAFDAIPTKIIACPNTCKRFRSAKNRSIEIYIGCETVGLEDNTADDAGIGDAG